MDSLAGVEIADPVIGLVASAALISIIIAAALCVHAKRHESSPDPLSTLFDKTKFDDEIENAAAQASRVHHRGAVLRGKLDHLPQVKQVWGHDTRDAAIAQVAQVMRAGVRKSDLFSEECAEDDGSFAIVTPGATEEEAESIAQRLLTRLGHAKIDGMGDGMRLTASFGVAGRRLGESDVAMRARAEAALRAAQKMGEEKVVAASDWEEVKMLPSPAPAKKRDSKAA